MQEGDSFTNLKACAGGAGISEGLLQEQELAGTISLPQTRG